MSVQQIYIHRQSITLNQVRQRLDIHMITRQYVNLNYVRNNYLIDTRQIVTRSKRLIDRSRDISIHSSYFSSCSITRQ